MNMYRTIMVAAFASLLALFSSTPLAGDLGVEGTVTATTFVGNGSGLTGVVKAEADPQVGSVTGSKWCVGDGAAVQCNQNAPVTMEVDPVAGTLGADKWCKADATASDVPSTAETTKGVAPLKPSTGADEAPVTTAQTVSPDILAGKAKNRNARPVRAGLRKFLPVPPNISFPITTPKEMPRATCHRGIVGGRVSGNNRPVTRNPSLILCFLRLANSSSQKNPTP